MPEIKHTFLAGKMNKSLDDRLVPEGEYRDAQNVEVTTDTQGGGDIGTVRKVRGNTALTSVDEDFSGTPEVIGSFFDDKNNSIYYFVTDNTTHKIYRYKTANTPVFEIIAEGDYLNFSKSNLITGVNILDRFLFWTDNNNPPRRIDLLQIESDSDFYYDLDDDTKVSVIKYSPFLAPSILFSNDNTIDSDYIKERFVRFSYRYKYNDGTYSQLAPFSPIAFLLEDDELTSSEIEKAYERGLLDSFVNHANKVVINAPLPDNPISVYGITSVEFLIKDANLPSVRIIKRQSVDSDLSDTIQHTYKSELPVSTLQEKELLRVSENLPIKARAQEVVGNRVVYGNFTENYDLPTLNYTISYSEKSESAATKYPNHSIKQRRNYEVGIVLSDKFGRKSPVILGSNSVINVAAKNDEFDATSWSGDSIKLSFTSLPSGDWYSYRIVVKQTQQEYYNVYIPGLSSFNGITYFTTFGDNVNKVPRDSSSITFENEISNSNAYVYPKVINGRFYIAHVENKGTTDLTRTSYNIIIPSGSSVFWSFWEAADNKYVNEEIASSQTINVPAGDAVGGLNPTVEDVKVYVDGLLAAKNLHYTVAGGSNITSITFTSTYEQPVGRTITIFKKLRFSGQAGTTGHVIKSLTYPEGTFAGGSATQVSSEEFNIYTYDGDGTTPLYPSVDGGDVYQSISDGPLAKVQGIGTLSNYSDITSTFIQTSDSESNRGFYKANNNYLVASVAEDLGFNLTGDNLIIRGKVHDLAVLETKPFESSIDIYYETPTSGLVDDLELNTTIEVDYYNTFIVKGDDPINSEPRWHIEESRIRGDFNGNSVDFGVIAHTTDSDYSRTTRYNTLIYSGIYNPRTGFNETNQFPYSENITKSLEIQYGSIQKLFAEDNDLIVFQEEKVSNIPIDRDIIYTAEGNPQVVTSNVVFGDVIPYAGNFGIGTNPESFAYYAGRKYFVDEPKGAVLRLSRDGITEISNYGMRTYLLGNLVGSNKIYGMWDMEKRLYVLSYQGGSTEQTLAFDENSNGWVSFYSYLPEFGGSLDGSFYTFNSGILYKHYNGTQFYGQDFIGSVSIVMNQNPSASKNFLTVNYEGSETWNISNISTDIDNGLPINAFNNNLQDNENSIFLRGFKKFDGKYFANIINASTAENNEVIFGGDVSGLKGYFLNLTLTNSNSNSELFSVSTNYNINSY